jgi:hypothetical protein
VINNEPGRVRYRATVTPAVVHRRHRRAWPAGQGCCSTRKAPHKAGPGGCCGLASRLYRSDKAAQRPDSSHSRPSSPAATAQSHVSCMTLSAAYGRGSSGLSPRTPLLALVGSACRSPLQPAQPYESILCEQFRPHLPSPLPARRSYRASLPFHNLRLQVLNDSVVCKTRRVRAC